MKNKLFLLVFILVACTGSNPNKLSENKRISKSFFEINIETTEARQKTRYLTDLASAVEYIKLETNKNCILNHGAKILITDSLILVNNQFHVLKFSRSGKFLGQISNYGRGPGENLAIGSISVIPEKNIIAIQTFKKILLFSFDGKLIESIRTPTFTSSVLTADDKFIAYYHGGLGNELFTFLLTNRKIDTISYVINPLKWRDNVPNSFMIDYPYFEPFYQNRNQYYFKSIYNDTVYSITDNNINPSYYINLGKYRLPAEWQIERIMLKEPEKFDMLIKKSEGCYYCNVSETSNKIFLTLVSFKKHIPKYFLFERDSVEKGYFLINKDKEAACIINDLDGGIDFWPEGKIDDKHLYMTLSVKDLKMKIDQRKVQKDLKLTIAEERFKKMTSDIDITANPIIMIVTLK